MAVPIHSWFPDLSRMKIAGANQCYKPNYPKERNIEPSRTTQSSSWDQAGWTPVQHDEDPHHPEHFLIIRSGRRIIEHGPNDHAYPQHNAGAQPTPEPLGRNPAAQGFNEHFARLVHPRNIDLRPVIVDNPLAQAFLRLSDINRKPVRRGYHGIQSRRERLLN